ncbi:uncharacterized protein [Physcomitrium patens]|uniref:uncharacterized protein isoform X4 n=1 Tax=Physcomitrium patens TaxID=3218 RepID=UPI000D153C95|nr:myosin-10-like isoform X4 [Physcomitrium patens]XP_024376173.1 myosin-10-like isoform X4 [Physcomitrium patens]|eukprot:XP_024376172.1 myosin-10-like isoform X4 [Physcomitrella patens]
MEHMDTDDLIVELQACPNYSDSYMGLIPRRMHLMYKYLDLKGEEPWPFLEEYFGVALAFAALGALIHNTNKMDNEMNTIDLHSQRVALESMLSKTMGWLHKIAQDALHLQDRFTASEIARDRDSIAWKEEKAVLVKKIESAELEVIELKKRREEDSRANEKVVRIYATQEQTWKSERKKLRHEIGLLRKDLLKAEVGELCGYKSTTRGNCCEMCDQMGKHLKELQAALSEKQSLLVIAVEEARSADQKHKDFLDRLAIAEGVEVQLSQELEKEVEVSVKRQLLLSMVEKKKEEVEERFSCLLEELNTTRKYLSTSNSEVDRLRSELDVLRQENQSKDAEINRMMELARITSEEMKDLAKKFEQILKEKEIAEIEIDYWRRLADDTGAKLRPIAHKEETHWHEMKSYGPPMKSDEQLRATDERLSALRSKPLAMKSGTTNSKSLSQQMEFEASANNLNCNALALCDEIKTVQNPIFDFERFDHTTHQQILKELQLELDEAKEKLRVQDLEHKAMLIKLTEKGETELQQKDLQLATVEAKLCQVLLQLDKMKRNEVQVSSEQSEEKIFLQYINEDDQEVLPVSTKKETEKNIPASETIEDSMQIDQEDEGELGFEVLLHQGNLDLERASNTQENNSADVVQCHNASRLERVCSFSYALDPCSSPNKDDIVEKPLKITEFDMGFTFSTTVQILKVEDNPALSQNLSRSRSSVKRKRETIPRTNDSSEEESDSAVSYEDIDDAVIPIPMNGTQPLDEDLFNALGHHSRNSLSTLRAGSHDPTSPVFAGGRMERTVIHTREDIEILGLALEVRRIDQQLAEMEKAGGVESSEIIQFRIPTAMVDSSLSKQPRRSAGLVERVNRLAKHMGFTSPVPIAVINSFEDVNRICIQGAAESKQDSRSSPQPSENPPINYLTTLQRRAEIVSEKLVAIRNKLLKCSSSGSSLFPTHQLMDNVQAHLLQVQTALRARLTTITMDPAHSISANQLAQVHPMAITMEEHKSRRTFGREPKHRSSKYHLYAQALLGYSILYSVSQWR